MFRWIDHVLWIPSRTYNKEENSVGREYDAWAEVNHVKRFYYLIFITRNNLIFPLGRNFRALLGRTYPFRLLRVSDLRVINYTFQINFK